MLNKMTKLTLCLALVFTMLFATAVGAMAADIAEYTELPILGSTLRSDYGAGTFDTIKFSSDPFPTANVSSAHGESVNSWSEFTLDNGTYYIAKQTTGWKNYSYSNIKTFTVNVPTENQVHSISTTATVLNGVQQVKANDTVISLTSPTTVALGSTVVVTITPINGKMLDAVTVTDNDGKTVSVTATETGCTFVTDGENVKEYTISATTKDANNKIYAIAGSDVTITFEGNAISRDVMNPTTIALSASGELKITAPSGKFISSVLITEGISELQKDSTPTSEYTYTLNTAASGQTYVVTVGTTDIEATGLTVKDAEGIVGTKPEDLAAKMFKQITFNYGDSITDIKEAEGLSYSIDNSTPGAQTVTFSYGDLTADATLTLKHPHTIAVTENEDANIVVKDADGNEVTDFSNIPAGATYYVEATAKDNSQKVTGITVEPAAFDFSNGSFTTAAGTTPVTYTITVSVGSKDTINTEIRFDADFLAQLNALFPNTDTETNISYTVDEIKQALLDGVYAEGQLISKDVSVTGSLDLTKEDAQALTYSYAGDNSGSSIYGASTNTVTVDFANFFSTVQLTSNVGGAAVTFDGTDLTDGQVKTLDDNVSGELKVVPVSDHYIADVKVNNTTVMDYTTTTGVYSFNTGRAANTVDVTTKKAQLVLKSDTLNYNTMMGTDVAKERIAALIDTDASVPGIPNGGKLTIKYKTGLGELSSYLKDYEYMDLGAGLGALDSIMKYLPSSVKEQIEAYFHEFGTQDTETVQITYEPNNKLIPTVSATVTLKIDDTRIATQVNLSKNELTYTYSSALTGNSIKGDVLALFENVSSANGIVTSDPAAVKVEVSETGALNVGDYTATISFPETWEYEGSSAQVKITVQKANADVIVNSQVVTYGDKINTPVSTDPKDASFISFAVGLDVTSGSYIHLNLPELVDLDAIDNPIVKAAAQKVLEGINENLSGDINLSDLASVLNGVVSMLESVEGYDLPINLDTQSIKMLSNALNTVTEYLPEGANLTVKITIAGDIVPTNSGVYIIGGVVSDANYNTALNLGYLVIKPQATQAKLEFNFKDENFVVLKENLSKYDFGAHLADNVQLPASQSIQHLFIGVDAQGNPAFYTNVNDLKNASMGAYTQIAFIRGTANEGMIYAAPIVRPFIIAGTPVNVEFTTTERSFTYESNVRRELNARALYNGADVTSQGVMDIYYAGIEGDGEGYYAKNVGPFKAGVYNVTAIYYDTTNMRAGIATTVMTIKPSDVAEITVANRNETQGTVVYVNDMVTSSPADAAKTVITSAVNVSGDFSAQGISALSGIVNVDFPARVDELLTKAGLDLSKPIGVDGLRKALSSALSKANEAVESDLINQAIELMDQIPANVNLTFNNNVSYDDIGVYVVIGAITDPDYTLKTDYGLLVISPKVTTAELRWNYNDVNGIITRPILTTPGLFDASAYVDGQTQPDAALTAKIRYLFVGVNADGEPVLYTNASQITKNGVYFQLAYIYDEISADIAIVKPISRVFALVPQDVNITVDPQVITVDQAPYNMAQNVTVTKRDNGVFQPNALSIYYMGTDVEGNAYYSSESPMAVGEYTVVALYVEQEGMMARSMMRAAQPSLEDIDLSTVKYAGAGVGYLTILPEGSELPEDPADPENPTNPDDPNNPAGPGGEASDALSGLPQTGDSSNVALWMALLSVSAAAVIILLKRKANA